MRSNNKRSIEMIFTQGLTDNEHLSLMSNKEIYAEILLGILRYIPTKEKPENTLYKEELKAKLKFNHIDEPDLLRACIDLLEDTESAIKEYCQNGLGHGRGTGEQYLRLYGLLNAVNQQIAVMIEFVELFSFPPKKEHKKRLKDLPIYHLRNKLAAHTINHQLIRGKAIRDNIDFFRVAQSTINRWGNALLIISHRAKSETLDLTKLVEEYQTVTDALLEHVCHKAIHALFPNNSEHKQWLTFRFDFVKQRRTSKQV